MKKLLILGAGTGGTIMANKMRKLLTFEEWQVRFMAHSLLPISYGRKDAASGMFLSIWAPFRPLKSL